MRRLWGRPTQNNDGLRCNEANSPDDSIGLLEDRDAGLWPYLETNNDDLRKAQNKEQSGDNPVWDQCQSGQGDGGGIRACAEAGARDAEQEGGGDHGGGGEGITEPPRTCSGLQTFDRREWQLGTETSAVWSVTSSPTAANSEIEGEDNREEADRVLSLSLFDEILNQNAIPTIRQNSKLICNLLHIYSAGLVDGVTTDCGIYCQGKLDTLAPRGSVTREGFAWRYTNRRLCCSLQSRDSAPTAVTVRCLRPRLFPRQSFRSSSKVRTTSCFWRSSFLKSGCQFTSLLSVILNSCPMTESRDWPAKGGIAPSP